MSLSFDYMCMRLPFILWSIAGVPSIQALTSFFITVSPSVCVSDVIGALVCGFQTKKNKLGMSTAIRSFQAQIGEYLEPRTLDPGLLKPNPEKQYDDVTLCTSHYGGR